MPFAGGVLRLIIARVLGGLRLRLALLFKGGVGDGHDFRHFLR